MGSIARLLKKYASTAKRKGIFAHTHNTIVDSGFPWLKPTDVVRMLDKALRLDLVLPEETLPRSRVALATYWKRYRAVYPTHDVFTIVPPEELEFTIPIKLHGDEGRSTLTLSHESPKIVFDF